MNWKNLSYWLKGTIIGIIVAVIIGLFGFFYLSVSESLRESGTLFQDGLSGLGFTVGLFIIPAVIILGIIGAIIGWIVGKIKKIDRDRYN